MNHSERIAYTARSHRHLTRNIVRDAVDTYLDKLAADIANGEWVEIPGIGKMQVVKEQGAGYLMVINTDGKRTPYIVGLRLRTKIRLTATFRKRCRAT